MKRSRTSVSTLLYGAAGSPSALWPPWWPAAPHPAATSTATHARAARLAANHTSFMAQGTRSASTVGDNLMKASVGVVETWGSTTPMTRLQVWLLTGFVHGELVHVSCTQ